MHTAAENPIHALVLFSPDQMPPHVAEGLVEWANGRRLRGLGRIIGGDRGARAAWRVRRAAGSG